VVEHKGTPAALRRFPAKLTRPQESARDHELGRCRGRALVELRSEEGERSAPLGWSASSALAAISRAVRPSVSR